MPKHKRTFEIYLVHVDEDSGDGCEECVKYCPCDVVDFFHKAIPARHGSCRGCRTCEAVCKSRAIIITEI